MKQNKVIVYTSPLSLPPKVRSAGCCWVVPQVEQPSRSVILGQRLVRGVADTSPAPSEPSHHPPSRTWSRPTWTIVACIYTPYLHTISTLYLPCPAPGWPRPPSPGCTPAPRPGRPAPAAAAHSASARARPRTASAPAPCCGWGARGRGPCTAGAQTIQTDQEEKGTSSNSLTLSQMIKIIEKK